MWNSFDTLYLCFIIGLTIMYLCTHYDQYVIDSLCQ